VKLEKGFAGESELKAGPDINSLKRRIIDLENKTKNLTGLEESKFIISTFIINNPLKNK
jgi:hypothetical protein